MIYIVIPTTKARRRRTQELVRSIQENSDGMEYSIVIFENELGGWVPAVHKALEGFKDDAIVWLLGSDCIVEKGALYELDFAYTHVKRAIVLEPYNELHGGNLCQHPFGPVRLIKKYLDSRFTHWYSDNLFTDLARRDAALLYVPEARIQHNHFVNGKAPKDSTYETIFDPATVEKDRLLYDKLRVEYGL